MWNYPDQKIMSHMGSREDLERALQEFDRGGIHHGEIKDLEGLGILVMAFRDQTTSSSN
jgi:hypothetical protein